MYNAFDTPVTMVTKDASLDDLTLADYADMVAELRQAMSFDKMIAALGSVYSKALWAKVADGATPNREQRNELRRYFGKPALPPTVAEATAQASPDAAVWTVGEGVPDTVVMVALSEPLTLRVNGSVSVVTDCHAMASNSSVDARKRIRRTYSRPCATEAQNSRKEALGVSWAEVIDAGLRMFEVMA